MCADGAECIPPDDPPLRDGAAFDTATRSWRPIAPAPAGFYAERPAVVGGDVYVLTCVQQQQCATDGQLMRYRPADDAWDTLPGPPADGSYQIAPAGDDLLAYSPSEEAGEVPDWLFDTGAEVWQALPADPLPPSYDRHIVSVNGDLMVFAKHIDPSSIQLGPITGARLDTTTGTWTELPKAPASGFQAWALDGMVVINPHFTGAGGGIFKPATGEWGPLPDPPTAPSWDGDMAGALGADTAVFAYWAGWVLDVPSRSWIEIPRLDDREIHPEAGASAVGRRLFVFGGERRPSGSDGELLDDAWIWTPSPPASNG